MRARRTACSASVSASADSALWPGAIRALLSHKSRLLELQSTCTQLYHYSRSIRILTKFSKYSENRDTGELSQDPHTRQRRGTSLRNNLRAVTIPTSMSYYSCTCRSKFSMTRMTNSTCSLLFFLIPDICKLGTALSRFDPGG